MQTENDNQTLPENSKSGQSSELASFSFESLERNVDDHSQKSQRSKVFGRFSKPIAICAAISFGGFIFGWDVGTIGGITNMESFQRNFGMIVDSSTGVKNLPELVIGLIISIFNIGCAIGGLTLTKLGDFRGRKFGIYVAVLFYWAGLVIQLTRSHTWQQFLIGRITTGLAVGSMAVLVPMFISESAPVKIRGAMIALYQLMVTLGILAGNITNYICVEVFLARPRLDIQWQLPIMLGFIWSLVIVTGLVLIPESAQYLILKQDQIELAKTSFAKMNGISKEDQRTYHFINETMRERQNMIKMGEQQGIFEFITGKPKLGLRLLVGVLAMIFQQLSGVNYFFYYGTTIFERAHLDPYTTPIVLSMVNFAATFGGIFLVEALGRKCCLLLGSIGMCISMTLYATIGSFALDMDGSNTVLVVTTCVYIVFFATTLGPVTFVLVSELFPMKTRATSMAICSSFNWMFNFAIALLTPTVTSRIGFLYGYFFAACLLLSAIFVWILVPETRNLTETDINDIYEKPDVSC